MIYYSWDAKTQTAVNKARFSFSSKSNFLSDLLKYIIISYKFLILSFTKTLYFGKLDFAVFFQDWRVKK